MTDYIETIIDLLLAHPLAGPINNDVYQPMLKPEPPAGGGDWPYPPFCCQPRCVYFYYVRFDRDGALRVDHYFYPNGPLDDSSQWQPIGADEIEGIIARLAQNGRPHTQIKSPPKLPEHNFEKIKWRYVSYVAIFVDEAYWKLHERSGGRGALVFNPQKGSTPNSSFFDAQNFEIDMGDPDTRTAICFIDHMTVEQADGSVVMEDTPDRKYVFDLYFDVAFADVAIEPAVIILDPTSTNQGPPQNP